MSELDKKAFENVYRQLKAPEALKADTLSKVLEENGKRKAVKGRKRVFQYGALAAALCAAVICFILIRPLGISFVTPMEEGVYYDEVELKDGVIHFVKNRVAISIKPNAGTVVIGQNDKDADESENADSGKAEEKITKSGGSISFQKIAALNLPEIAEENWSYIGEQKIYVTVLNANEIRYQAAFEKDGVAYEVIGTNVTQKEFIEELYRYVKK